MSPKTVPRTFSVNNFVSNYAAIFFFVNNFFQTTTSIRTLWVINMTLHVIGGLLRGDRWLSVWAAGKPRSAGISVEDDRKNEEMCETETPKISKLLDSISELMNLMERQRNCDQLRLLHLQTIKTYVAKKRHHVSRQ
jgi:hypothetical protein